MHILIIQALIEHPVTNKPHRIITTYPVIKENENTRAVTAEPGYVIVAVQMIDDKAAETYNPQPPRVPMYYTSPQYLGEPRPDPVSHEH